MHLVAPIRNINEIDFLLKNWIKEVYWWYIDLDVKESTNWNGIINWRWIKEWNFKDILEIQDAVKALKKNNITFKFTFNTLPYYWDDKILSKAIDNSLKIWFDKVIVADYNLIKHFKNKEITISTLWSIYNSEIIKFFKEKHKNIKRFILPRELSIHEQKTIIANSDKNLEFELLIINDWCYNNNSICGSAHDNQLKKWSVQACHRDIHYKSDDEEVNLKLNTLTKKRIDCKVCIMYHFKNYKNIFFKIAWRAKDSKKLKKDILFTSCVKKYVNKHSNYKDFVKDTMKTYKKIYWCNCNYEKCEIYQKYYTTT